MSLLTLGPERLKGANKRTLPSSTSRKIPMRGAGWRARKRLWKDREERTAPSHERQVSVARTRADRLGKRRKISRSWSWPSEDMVVVPSAAVGRVVVVAVEGIDGGFTAGASSSSSNSLLLIARASPGVNL